MKMASKLPSGNGSRWMSLRTNGTGAGPGSRSTPTTIPRGPTAAANPTVTDAGPQPRSTRRCARTDMSNEERGDRVNSPTGVRRTMPLPQKRLVDGTHVHHHIIASLQHLTPMERERAGDLGRCERVVPDAVAGHVDPVESGAALTHRSGHPAEDSRTRHR